ncbi:MAG: RHS repeat-associated core domain-containing protein [Allomuricauda sp.]
MEENNYYPFGLEHKGYNSGTSPLGNSVANRWKYNGQENGESFGLNMTEMTFRQYDATLGRFNVVDPLAEIMYDITPYRFAYNNPIYWSDPSGLIEESVLRDLYRRSRSGTKWYNDGHSGFYTDNGGYVAYTSDNSSQNTSPDYSLNALSEVVVHGTDDFSIGLASNQVYNRI